MRGISGVLSPPIKPERQGLSFAVHGWTAPKNPIQASDFRASFVDWLRGSLVDRVVEARKINEPNAGRRRRRGLKLVHSWSAKKSTDEARVQQ
jgi:hypothetical protein